MEANQEKMDAKIDAHHVKDDGQDGLPARENIGHKFGGKSRRNRVQGRALGGP
jgi:hypothetical protein